jgi:hypothetical protein
MGESERLVDPPQDLLLGLTVSHDGCVMRRVLSRVCFSPDSDRIADIPAGPSFGTGTHRMPQPSAMTEDFPGRPRPVSCCGTGTHPSPIVF